MDPQALHLIVNHIPVVGAAWTLLLFVLALLRPEPALARVAHASMILVGMSAALAFYTGEPAEEVVEHLPGMVVSRIESHEDTAKIAFLLAVVGGLAAVVSLFLSFRRPRNRVPIVTGLVLTGVVLAAHAVTAHHGGRIHRPELESTDHGESRPPGHHLSWAE